MIAAYTKAFLQRALPRWSAIGARLYKPKLSTAYLGRNILEQDAVGQTVAGSAEALIAAQQAGHDIVLHLQDSGPEHLMAHSTYSHDGVVYFSNDKHICKHYIGPDLDDPDPFLTPAIYASNSTVRMARATISERRTRATLKAPCTHYRRWIWIEAARYASIEPQLAFLHAPYFKVIVRYPTGLHIVFMPNMIQSKGNTDAWMRGLESFIAKSQEILIPGHVLAPITDHPVKLDHVYRCFLQVWSGGDLDGRVRLFAADRWQLDDQEHDCAPDDIFSCETWHDLCFVAVAHA